MAIAKQSGGAAWLLLTFTLPTTRASQRVEVWRKLQRYGAVPLGNSGYLLPGHHANQERFQWLATAIRKYGGDASVVEVQSIDNLSTPQLMGRFAEARAREYRELIREVQKLSSVSPHKRGAGRLSRLRSRFQEIVEIDFFNNPLQKRVQELLHRADASHSEARTKQPSKINPRDYTARVWVTRPRPGIDRSASAWLIRKLIDRKARFIFARQDAVPRGAVPYDMFQGGFGHRGEDCTFETLQKDFRLKDHKVKALAEIIHDADLSDEKFGRKEGFGIDEVLKGWGRLGLLDRKILERGIQMIEGLYQSLA